jgi:hypothetical protein
MIIMNEWKPKCGGTGQMSDKYCGIDIVKPTALGCGGRRVYGTIFNYFS